MRAAACATLCAALLFCGCTIRKHGWIPCDRELNEVCGCAQEKARPICNSDDCAGGHLSHVSGKCKAVCARCAKPFCDGCHHDTCQCDYSAECGCGCPTGDCCECGDTCAAECGPPCEGPVCEAPPCDDPHCDHKHHKCSRMCDWYEPEAGIFNFCTPPMALTALPPPPPGRFFPVPVKPVFSRQPPWAIPFGYGEGYAGGPYGPGAPGGPMPSDGSGDGTCPTP